MAIRRLLWRLFPTYLLLIVICSAATDFFAWRAFRNLYYQRTEQSLRQRAGLIGEDIHSPLDTGRRAEVEAFCREAARLGGCRVTIILPDGAVLAESSQDPEHMYPHSDRPEVHEALAGRTATAVRHSYTLDTDMMYVAVPLEQGGRVIGVLRVAMPMSEIDAATRTVLVQIVVAMLVVVLLAALLALLISRMISRPLELIRAGAQRFARGELDHRLAVPPVEELAAVAQTLNDMAGQLDQKIRTVTSHQMQQAAILASMNEGVIAVDPDGRLLSMNDAAGAPLSIQSASVGQRLLHEVVRNSQLDALVREVLADGGPAEAEISVRAGWDERIVQVHATVLRDPEERSIGALLVFNDVTRLRRLERVRQDFVANVSHELKTPITSIKGFVETLREGAIDEPEEAKRFLEIIASQSDRLNSIIEDLLALSRIEEEAQRKEIPLSPGTLEPVIRDAVALHQARAEAKGVAIEVDAPADLSARVNGPLLEQAIANLLDNAIKYSDTGSAIRIVAARDGENVTVSVQDHGCGIPAEHLPRLFERFYRVDKARSRQLGGTGLGLSIVKHIIAAHGGSVSVTSTPGEGSTFTIHLAGGIPLTNK
ncbi:MAG: ATP-binding protein [Phycisphaerae bacterium]|nr:ATP-binding protein [Phycisphaerae bacterium]